MCIGDFRATGVIQDGKRTKSRHTSPSLIFVATYYANSGAIITFASLCPVRRHPPIQEEKEYLRGICARNSRRLHMWCKRQERQIKFEPPDSGETHSPVAKGIGSYKLILITAVILFSYPRNPCAFIEWHQLARYQRRG